MPDNIPDLKVGSVIKIINFKYPNLNNEIKPVWMVYLGRDSLFSCDIFLHLHRFTTQIQHYGAKGTRDSSLTIPFTCNQYGIFADACVIDFNEPGYPMLPDRLSEHKYEIKGVLPEDVLRRIWKLINKSRHYSAKQIASIRESYSRAGISNLK